MQVRASTWTHIIKGHAMKPKALLLALASGLVFQIACGEKQADLSSSDSKPVPVNVLPIQYESVTAIVEAPGTVQSRNSISLNSQINGFVREMHVRVGDRVKPNQLLATLDARDAESQKAAAQAAIEEAHAALSEARRAHQAAVEMQSAAKASAELAGQTFARYQKLFESRSASPQEIDEVRMRRDASAAELASRVSLVAAAEDRVKQVEARLSQVKAQAGRADVLMSWTQIVAPSSGKIVERLADPGTAIFPGSPLLTMESMADPQVLADLPTDNAGSLHAGMNVRLRSADKAETIEGRVSEIMPRSSPVTHSVQFKVDLPSDAALPNGQFVKVAVPVGKRNALLVPNGAVRKTGQLTGLFVVDGASKARFRLAKISLYDADRSEILSGVNPGENIITNLNERILDGIPVENRP
jgi:multidrug efflux pump subunit AcrA (membrane-fusion protein)